MAEKVYYAAHCVISRGKIAPKTPTVEAVLKDTLVSQGRSQLFD